MQSVTTFDGYGRPATQKQPQQSAPDDLMLTTRTIPFTLLLIRAAWSRRMLTNGRHLLTGVSYTAPSGIDAPSPISFGYDAVGNRTGMSDGTGAISYGYNQLSRLTSETRIVHRAQQLLHDWVRLQSRRRVNERHRSIGRASQLQLRFNRQINEHASIRLHGRTNFLTNVQYRAFGGISTRLMANSVQVDLSYNLRMQIGQYQVSGFHQWANGGYNGAAYSMGATMSYYNDGRTNTAFDFNDSKFDRKYDF